MGTSQNKVAATADERLTALLTALVKVLPVDPALPPGASRHSLSGLKLLGSGGIRTHAPEETGA